MLTRSKARQLAQSTATPTGDQSFMSRPKAPPKPNLTSKSKSSSNINMASSLTHKFTNIAPAVTKFSGRKKGELTCDLEAFLSQVDDYLAAKPNLSDAEKLAEAKQFIDSDPTKGDISLFTRTNKYRVLIQTYPELKAYLRKAYATIGQADPVNSLALILPNIDKVLPHFFSHRY